MNTYTIMLLNSCSQAWATLSSLSNIEFKNVWRYISTSPYVFVVLLSLLSCHSELLLAMLTALILTQQHNNSFDHILLSHINILILVTSSVYSLWIKPTDALNSNFIAITTVRVSGSLSAHHQEFLAIHRLWYILCSCDEPFATRSRMAMPVVKCTKSDVRLRNPDDGQNGCPKHVE